MQTRAEFTFPRNFISTKNWIAFIRHNCKNIFISIFHTQNQYSNHFIVHFWNQSLSWRNENVRTQWILIDFAFVKHIQSFWTNSCWANKRKLIGYWNDEHKYSTQIKSQTRSM